MADDQGKIRITWDDVNKAEADPPTSFGVPGGRPVAPVADRSWGTVSPQPQVTGASVTSGGSVFLKGWFYLGVAGVAGAFLAWGICEPSLNDYRMTNWAAKWLLPLMVMLMSLGFGTVECIIERTWKRLPLRGLAACAIAIVLGFAFQFVADFVFRSLLRLIVKLGVDSAENFLFWISRSLAWAVFGMAGGLVYGIVSKSRKKTIYGMLGGVIGAAIGGLLFDPISMLTDGGEASRAIGFSIFGVSTGIAIGLVESALKDRWLYVSGGPLAGKQFVLYQDLVTLGRSQSNTIYLFKDPGILDQHATIEHRTGRSLLTAYGPVMVSGQPLQSGMKRTLNSGDVIQIGRYSFTYAENERAARP